MKSKKFFFITGAIGVVLIGLASTLLFVKNSFGSNIFSSSDRGCVPYNIFVSKGNADYSVKIVWSTLNECVGFVQYGSQRDSINLVGVDQKYKVKSKSHEVVLEKLLTTQKYYFLINSDDVAYGYNGTAIDFSLANL